MNFLVKGRFEAACPLLFDPGITGIADDRQQPSAAVRPAEPAKEFEGAQVGRL
jgi:hypothetical protein